MEPEAQCVLVAKCGAGRRIIFVGLKGEKDFGLHNNVLAKVLLCGKRTPRKADRTKGECFSVLTVRIVS